MSKVLMESYIQGLVESNLRRLLSIWPIQYELGHISGVNARACLKTLGLILAERVDLIEDPKISAKFQYPPEKPQLETETTQSPTIAATPSVQAVELDQSINISAVRKYLTELSIYKSEVDIDQFVTFVMNLDEFKDSVNKTLAMLSGIPSETFEVMLVALLGEETLSTTDSRRSRLYMAIKSTLVKMDMQRVLRLWYVIQGKEKSVDGDYDKKVVTIVAEATRWLLTDSENPEDFARFLVQQSLFKGQLELLEKIPVITHFGRRSKSLDEAVEDTLFVIPTKSILTAWRLSQLP